MDDETEALEKLAFDFFSKEAAPHEKRYGEQQHVDRDLWNKAGALGLLCASIPEEYGGGGGTFPWVLRAMSRKVPSGTRSGATPKNSSPVTSQTTLVSSANWSRVTLARWLCATLEGIPARRSSTATSRAARSAVRSSRCTRCTGTVSLVTARS